MASYTREKIYKSWSHIPEVTLIKEVATKGEHIQLCIDYLASKKQIPLQECKQYFHDVVDSYVARLLGEKLVCKAENVLKHVQRNVKCVFLEFGFECTNEEVKEAIVEHLKKKDPVNFEEDMRELYFYHCIAIQIKNCPDLLEQANKESPKRMSLENFLHLSESTQRKLMAKLYIVTRNANILSRIKKQDLWDCFVEGQHFLELIQWCFATETHSEEDDCFSKWPVEVEMYEFALNKLKNPPDTLRNHFARKGFIFTDEKFDVPLALRRICSSESFKTNKEIIDKLAIGQFIMSNPSLYPVLLREFVSTRELEEIRESTAKDKEFLDMILSLKYHDIKSRAGFQQITYSVRAYLDSKNLEFDDSSLSLVEFLMNDANSVSSLNAFLHSNQMTYLQTLAKRLETTSPTLPSPYDFLKRFKNLDFQEICNDSGVEEVASFSNPLLCEKFSRKYQLNFLHYLKQQRSSYAAYFFFIEHLKSYSQITKAQLFTSTETVAELALQSSTNTDLVAHCVAFSEMLGFDTQNLRSFIKLTRMSDGQEENGNQFFGFGDLIVNCEQRLAQELDVFPLSEYQALMRIAECNQYKKWPEVIIEKYCRANDWWKVLVLIQFFDIPLEQVKKIARLFRCKEIGEHIIRALSFEPGTEKPKRRPSVSRQKSRTVKYENLPSTTSAETMTSSMSSQNDPNALFKASNQIRFLHENDSLDIFAIILVSSNSIPEERIFSDLNKFLEIILDSHSYSTSVNLMKNSVSYNLPILALLSATVSSQNLDWNWLIWLTISTDFWDKTISNINTLSYGINRTVWALIEHCVCDGYVQMLYQSFDIFYKESPFSHFTTFLHETNQHNFTDDVVNELRLFLLAWSNDDLELPLCENPKKDQIMFQITRLLMLHLKENFSSRFYQEKFLTLICHSGISDISGIVDFCLLKEAFTVIRAIPSIEINFLNLLDEDNVEYNEVLGILLETNRYDEAIKLSSLLSLPISNIVYAKWISEVESLDSEILDFDRYEQEIVDHSLPPEILVTFCLFSAGRINQFCPKKYMLLKRALDVIKSNHLFPNESFDRDQIEYDMVLCYLEIPEEDVDKLDIYYSEYFEEIMLKERCVLYKSFLELKELAGIEDLTTSLKTELTEKMKLRLALLLNKLLDDGDIVEALRLQALFEYRPIDLHFIVFCMALAEGLTTLRNLSHEERQMLSEIEKSSFSKFNKRTLGNLKPGGASSPYKMGDLSDSSSTMELLEFEEIPPKEKQETLNAIQGIASKLKFGVNLGKRIVMTYRAAMYLDKEYIDVLRTKDQAYLLKKATKEECLHKLLVVSDIFTSTQMTPMEIAEHLSFEIATAVIRPRFYIFEVDQQSKSNNQLKNSVLWGFNLEKEFHLFLELCPSTTLLGNSLLEYCDALKTYRKFQDGKEYEETDVFQKLSEIIRLYGLPNAAPGTTQVLSHKKQNLIYVELLIKAHQCFVHECSMEGIANVLNRAKALNTILTTAKSWSLIVRMLIGLARYREMFYCFDSLIKNDQFESLLGQFEEYKAVSLRQAILTYLREYCPDNKDYLKLAGLHFSMYKELAEMWEVEGRDAIAIVSSFSQPGEISPEQLKISSQHASPIPKLNCTQDLCGLLNQALDYFTHATESYLMDNKLLPAQKSVAMAELVAMQIDLVNKGLATGKCVSVLAVQSRDDLKELVYSELRVPQAMILSRAYSLEINWAEAILFQYVVLERKAYLTEFQNQMHISDSIIENVVKGFQLYSVGNPTNRQMEENLCALVEHVQSIALKYKLASLLNMKSTVMSLLNEQTVYYLKDTNYGRNEGNIADV
ncbi:spatacsin [Episyrphus balteatus]|uniref:spatacsin n=1 Tax=Episyrphus balteatus TaxID=286459 RepID=UPI0024858673|nr:spatacsin [Episyrphus balteatus]